MESGDELDHGPGLSPEAVEEADFATVRRGFAPKAVRARLSEAATEIRRLNALVGSLSERVSELAAELENAPPAELEPSQMTEALGDEAARVLQTARDAAQERIDRAEAEGDGIKAEAEAAAASIIEESRTEGRAMVAEAGKVRERILADLAAKRHEHRVEVERLRVMRDRFMEALTICREGLDGWMDEVAQAEAHAAAAAERAGQRVAAERAATVGEIEAEIKAGRMVGLPLDGQPESTDSADTALADTGPEETATATEPPDAESVSVFTSPLDEAYGPEGAGLEDRDEFEESDEGVEIVGYAPPPTSSVGLYDVEAEPEAGFDSELAAELGVEPALTEDQAPGGAADPAPDEAVAPAAGVGAEAIFARLRSIADRPVSEPVQPTGGAPPADGSVAPSVRGTEARPAGESYVDGGWPSDAEPSEPDDLVSAARAVAVGGIARRLKRMVVDEQGSLLDGIRRTGARAVRGTLSSEADHFARAAWVPMQDFASDIDVSIDDIDLKAAGEAIESTMVTSIRSRLGELVDDTEDPDELSRGVRSIYREARSRQAEEAARAAFAAAWPEPIS